MRKFGLLILGNIGSGKSTTCKALHKKLPDHGNYSLDQIRAELFEQNPNQNARERDTEANELLFQRCLNDADSFVLENVGTSKGFSRLIGRLKFESVFLYKVLLKCPPNECYDRWQSRGQFSTQIGPALGDPFKIKDFIHENDYNLKLGQYDLIIDTEKTDFNQGVKLILDKYLSDISAIKRIRS